MKKLLLISVIQLFIIFSCCDHPCLQHWVVKLVSTGDKELLSLNDLFCDGLREIDFIKCLRINNNNSKGLLSNLEEFSDIYQRSGHIVVHLNATGFYQTNYNDILDRNFTHAGHGNILIGNYTVNKCSNKPTILQEKCESRIEHECQERNEIIEENKKKYSTNCETTELQYNAKLVSKNVIEFPGLHNYINTFKNEIIEPEELCKFINIGVCGYPGLYNNRYGLQTRYELNCDDLNIDSSTIAILAPKPFNTIQKFYTTTIFYDDSDITEAQNMFHNYISLPQLETEKLKFAIHKYMQNNNWNRVAIISDNSPTSQNFERQLTSLFDKENVIYASRSCDVLNCDFTKLLKPLIKERAKLIIANVGDKSAMELTDQVSKMQIQAKLAWIFTSTGAMSHANYMRIGDVFSITMVPTFRDTDVKIDALKHIIDNYLFTNIILMQLYKQLPLSKTMHSIIASHLKTVIQNVIKNSNIKVQVFYSTNIIAEMDITPENNVVIHQDSTPQYLKGMTEIHDCMIKSSYYMKRCYDEEFMFFTLVLSVFVLMAVGIVYFFQSAEMSYSRMSR